jgi:DMSO/TMAO reductase YedYZ molybdopterin-dependent catalytic subunit
MSDLPPGQFWGHRFVTYTINGVPEIAESDYRFQLTGLVRKKLEFAFSELEQLGLRTLRADFHCVTKWSIRDCEWRGIPFSALAGLSGIEDGAEYAFIHSLDGYTTVVPMENMQESLLATELNGSRISQEQGAPVRLVVPSLYGWKSAKWLAAIELVEEYRDGFWEERGYHERGDFLTEERFKNPAARFLHKKVAAPRKVQ